MAQPKVLAKILVRIKECNLRLSLGWRPASEAKLEAAKWLRELDQAGLPETLTVNIRMQQRSDDIPDFVDSDTYKSDGRAALGIEYGARRLETYSDWGRGR